MWTVGKNTTQNCEGFEFSAYYKGQERGSFRTGNDCSIFCDWRNHLDENCGWIDAISFEEYKKLRSAR